MPAITSALTPRHGQIKSLRALGESFRHVLGDVTETMGFCKHDNVLPNKTSSSRQLSWRDTLSLVKIGMCSALFFSMLLCLSVSAQAPPIEIRAFS